MGTRGPVPKRTEQRRRRNATDSIESVPVATPIATPKADPDWNPIAIEWFESLGNSGQAKFYEPSDWAQARVWAEVLSRALKQGDRPSAVLIAAWSSGAGELLTTEGARRRLRLELERTPVADPDAERATGTITDLRSRLGG